MKVWTMKEKGGNGMSFRLLLSALLILGLTGCATHKKALNAKESEELQTKVSELETQVQEKDDQIKSLEDEMQNMSKGSSGRNYSGGSDSSMSSKQIQKALKSAGYYDGPIDGKVGKGTRKAIKAFQKANGLTVDGVVGRATGSALKKYLN